MSSKPDGLFIDRDGVTGVGIVTMLVSLVLLISCACGIVVGPLNNHDVHVGCLRLHEQTGLETKVARSGMTTECYIKTESGHWIPSENYRGIDE